MEKRKSKKRIAISAGLLALLCTIFFALQTWLEDGKSSFVSYERQAPARDFDLPLVSPSAATPAESPIRRVRLEQYSGKPLLIHFWASWCNICRDEKPIFDALWDKYQDKDLRILAIASYDTMQALAESKLVLGEKRFAVALDEEGDVANQYKVRALPETLLVDADGKIVWHFRGTLKDYDLKAIERYVQKAGDELSKSSEKPKLY